MVENELMTRNLCNKFGQSDDTFKCVVQSGVALCETSPLKKSACQPFFFVFIGEVWSTATEIHVIETDGSGTNPRLASQCGWVIARGCGPHPLRSVRMSEAVLERIKNEGEMHANLRKGKVGVATAAPRRSRFCHISNALLMLGDAPSLSLSLGGKYSAGDVRCSHL